MFDLDANPQAIHRILKQDPLLAGCIADSPGLRLPGSWHPFETAMRAIVGQQISVKGAVTQLGRIAMRAFAEPDAFPASDLGVIKALQTGEVRPTVAHIRSRAEAWRPWRAYATIYLWHG